MFPGVWKGKGRMGRELREADLCIWWVPRPGWVAQGQQASFLPREFLIGGPWPEGAPETGRMQLYSPGAL